MRRLRKAGAVIIGKTNLHEFAYGATNENPHYGPTHNPWAHERITGGSSGGSTAAVCGGLCVAAIGTDTGGSIRVPAALCGIVGLKPTFRPDQRPRRFPAGTHVRPRWAADAERRGRRFDPRSSGWTRSAGPNKRGKTRGEIFKRQSRQTAEAATGLAEGAFLGADPSGRAEAGGKGGQESGARGIDRGNLAADNALRQLEAANLMSIAEARAVHEQAGYFPARAAEYGEDVRTRLERARRRSRAVDYLKARATVERAKAEFARRSNKWTQLWRRRCRSWRRRLVGNGSNRQRRRTDARRPAAADAAREFDGLPQYLRSRAGSRPRGCRSGMQLIGRAFEEADLLGVARRYEEENPGAWRRPPVGA